ncbi:MAG: hypothetical protein A3C42_01210 [Chlamydiae bacterium RIFCSPHIGHO2_02_FULL_45_9]|nr:MAG: hypothetical protein A3C42_01210 [Chlamydiae bacterium RIFCSPHIGHO2_02_FULL_45_9]
MFEKRKKHSRIQQSLQFHNFKLLRTCESRTHAKLLPIQSEFEGCIGSILKGCESGVWVFQTKNGLAVK